MSGPALVVAYMVSPQELNALLFLLWLVPSPQDVKASSKAASGARAWHKAVHACPHHYYWARVLVCARDYGGGAVDVLTLHSSENVFAVRGYPTCETIGSSILV